jgi:hypothetical protein
VFDLGTRPIHKPLFVYMPMSKLLAIFSPLFLIFTTSNLLFVLRSFRIVYLSLILFSKAILFHFTPNKNCSITIPHLTQIINLIPIIMNFHPFCFCSFYSYFMHRFSSIYLSSSPLFIFFFKLSYHLIYLI